MRRFEVFVSERYLHTRKKGAFVRVMVSFARWGVGLGVFAMVITTALMNGFREEIQANLFTATAHFTIFHVLGDLPDTQQALATIRAVPGVVGASPMRMEKGLLKRSGNEAPPEGLAIWAIDPASAASTSSIFSTLKPGPLTRMQEGDLLIGQELAHNLGLRVGDPVAMLFLRMDLGPGGVQPKMMGLRVGGIFHSHISEYDKSWGFMHLEDAKRLARSQEAEGIQVRASSVEAIDKVKPAVLRALNQGDRGAYISTDLRDSNRALFAALWVEKLIFAIILGLIVTVAAFNILAVVVLHVTEKRRDIGVLLALGAVPRQIQRLYELQGMRIGAVGTAWGLGLAIPICLVADRFKLVKLPASVYDFITYVPFRLSAVDLLLIATFPILVSWWAARYPARRAARLNPVDTLRSE